MTVTQRDEFDAWPAGAASKAYPHGSLFTFGCLKERVHQRIRVLIGRIRQNLSTLAGRSSQSSGQMASQTSETLKIGQSLLTELQTAEPADRLVIDLEMVLPTDPDLSSNSARRDDDHLRIAKIPREVTALGEVQNATSHHYIPSLARYDNLSMSGNATRRPHRRRTGQWQCSDAGSGSRWFRSSSDLRPGDTILVPFDADLMRALPMWTVVTMIHYNSAISVAVVNGF